MLVRLYFIALPVFFIIDIVWLGLVAKNLYARQIGHLMKEQVHWSPAILFYLIFVAGLVLFVIAPAVEHNSWARAVLYGAVFGLVTYAAYDLTNMATVKDWPLSITVIDLIWGTVLAASVSGITFFIASRIPS